MNKFIFLILFVLVFTARVLSQSNTPESDFQVWNETLLVIPLKKSEEKKTARVSLIFYGLLRGGRNQGGFNDERIGLGVEFRINKYLTLTPGYIYRAGQPLPNHREHESRVRFDVGLEKKFKYFSIKDRNRVEHRFRTPQADSTRYRNKFQLNVPVKKDGQEIFAPFVATEPFYEFETKHWTRNEFSAGIAKKFNSNFSAEFFYMLQNNRGPIFRYVNIVGANLRFTID